MAVVTQDVSGTLGMVVQRAPSPTYNHAVLRSATGTPVTPSTGFSSGQYRYTVKTGTDEFDHRQHLMHFDMSAVRADAQVLGADLELISSGPNPGAIFGSPAGGLLTRMWEGAIDTLPFGTGDYARTDLGGGTALMNDIAYNGMDGTTTHAFNAAGLTVLNNKVPIGQGLKLTGVSVDLINNLDYYLGSAIDNGYDTALILTATLKLTLNVPDEGMMGVNF